VQSWFADDVSENTGTNYETVTCMACSLVHLVNPKTWQDTSTSAQ
jgi:hypothetical protein